MVEQMPNIRHTPPRTIAVSGGFDPAHCGHVRMLKRARELGDRVVVILNNDHWVNKKKGYVFMNQQERAEILRALIFVDEVYITYHRRGTEDMSVCSALEKLKPWGFANGGDRKADNIPEYDLCKKLGIKMFWNIGGGKVQSSSKLVERRKRSDHRKSS